jgi:hypothetical protein
METNNWEEVKAKPKPIRKKCEGQNCPDYFDAEWPEQRRCPRCKKWDRPYRLESEPF